MARKIKRVSQDGTTHEVVSQPVQPVVNIEPVIIVLACRLGQSVEQAAVTREMYLNDMLCEEDRAALLEEYKVLMQQVQQQMQKKQASRPVVESVDVSSARQNPRDPSRTKQRVTVRDVKTGMVVRLEDV